MARAIAVGTGTAVVAGALWMTSAGITKGTENSRDANTAALAAFERVASVLESPRCMNCHPRGDRPTQGDDRHVHLMNVQRGPSGKGMPAMACSTCHQGHNNDAAGIPGAPHWKLAPKSMGWTGLGRRELCQTLLDRSKNGGRTPTALLKHITGDALVRWAWNPGAGRSPPPISTEELKCALEGWVSAGAPCPQ
jgi:hypothetical protein